MLKINEIFHSIQGESSKAGFPCIFVRLTGCNLRCTYCDTEYAFYEGNEMSVSEAISEIEKYKCRLVEITGGEPLAQTESIELMKQLCDLGYDVMLETGGSLSVKDVDQRVMIVMDLKCPSSGMEKKNLYHNIPLLKRTDEIKFVIGSEEDYNWTKKIIEEYNLTSCCSILLSVVFSKLEPLTLVTWILRDGLKVRFQLQMHKFIWEPETKGV